MNHPAGGVVHQPAAAAPPVASLPARPPRLGKMAAVRMDAPAGPSVGPRLAGGAPPPVVAAVQPVAFLPTAVDAPAGGGPTPAGLPP